MKCFMHCSTLSTRVVRELEMWGLLLHCISCRRFMISGADLKAALSSVEIVPTYSCIAFCNASSFAGTSGAGEVDREGAGAAAPRRFVLQDIPMKHVTHVFLGFDSLGRYLRGSYVVFGKCVQTSIYSASRNG